MYRQDAKFNEGLDLGPNKKLAQYDEGEEQGIAKGSSSMKFGVSDTELKYNEGVSGRTEGEMPILPKTQLQGVYLHTGISYDEYTGLITSQVTLQPFEKKDGS